MNLLQLHNEYREKFSIALLVEDEQLNSLALEHASYMHRKGFISHQGFYERMKKIGAKAAENVAKAPNEEQVFKMWTNSPPHERNLSGNYTRAGFGRVGDYWCAIYSC